MRTKRRTFLALSGLSLAAGLGGCVSDGPENTGDGDPQVASAPRQFQTDAANTGGTGERDSGLAEYDPPVDVGLDTGLAPALADDTAYVTAWNGGQTHDRGLAAVALEDGSEQWRAVPDVGVNSAPTLAGDAVYTGIDAGPVVGDGIAFVAAHGGHVYALA